MSLEDRLVDQGRRINNLIRVGAVAEVDVERARVRVHYGAGAPGGGLEAQTELISVADDAGPARTAPGGRRPWGSRS